MPKKYCIKLTTDERTALEKIVRKQRVAANKKLKARILLLSDENGPECSLRDVLIAERSGMSVVSIERLRKRCHEMGPLPALERKAREQPPRRAIIDGELEARLIAEACSEAPEGHSRWTLRLLADRMVELELVESISYETVRETLKKTNFSLGEKNTGASPRRRMRPS
jgi:transposase